jgi:hypothetical protein
LKPNIEKKKKQTSLPQKEEKCYKKQIKEQMKENSLTKKKKKHTF